MHRLRELTHRLIWLAYVDDLQRGEGGRQSPDHIGEVASVGVAQGQVPELWQPLEVDPVQCHAAHILQPQRLKEGGLPDDVEQVSRRQLHPREVEALHVVRHEQDGLLRHGHGCLLLSAEEGIALQPQLPQALHRVEEGVRLVRRCLASADLQVEGSEERQLRHRLDWKLIVLQRQTHSAAAVGKRSHYNSTTTDDTMTRAQHQTLLNTSKSQTASIGNAPIQ